MAHFDSARLKSLSAMNNRTKQSIYDDSSVRDQTKNDPGLDQDGQAFGCHSAFCSQQHCY